MTHEIVNPTELAKPVGFAHAVIAAPGRTIYLGGQTAQNPRGDIVGTTIEEQFNMAARNVITALTAAGGRPEHLVSLMIYTTDVPAYRAALGGLASIYRQYFGQHYPAIALLGVAELFDPDALLELVGTAVVPA